MEILLVLVAVAIAGVIAVVMIKRQAAKIVSVEQDKPKAEASKQASVHSDTSAKKTEIPAVDKEVSEPAEIVRQTPKAASTSIQAEKQKKIPEDSALRRHYLSARQAEREVITNPYPTDSALRRHYESMSATTVNSSFASSGKTENPAQPVKKTAIPEDSTLRRHFLTQVQAEIESLLIPRPTDATLRRHYDSQVKAKMDEYLTEAAM